MSIATDNNGNVFITGYTDSPNFPLQNAGTFFQGTFAGGNMDVFILKFDNVGNRLWATYYGGSGSDLGGFIATDALGNVWVTGLTGSTNFPIQTAGSAFFQSLFGGGLGSVPIDAIILKFDNVGNRLWATYYGGNGQDIGTTIAIDKLNNVFITGTTISTNFPTQNAGTFFQGINSGSNDAFILKFDNVGNRLWATHYGGNGDEKFIFSNNDNITFDQCNNVYVSFRSTSNNISTQSSCEGGFFDNSLNGVRDQFLVEFNNIGNLLWATYIGGDGDDFRCPIAIDNNDNLWVAGEWTDVSVNTTYPLTNPGGTAYFDNSFNGQDDAMIAKFVPTPILTDTSTIAATCAINGSATVTVSGLCPPIDYLWSNGSQTLASLDTFNTVTNLPAGNYTVTIQGNCDTIVQNVIISQTGTPVFFTQNPIICQGSSVTVNGNVYTTTGTFNDTIFGGAANGCDSMITTNLTVNITTTGIDVINSCTPITWIDGLTYSTSTITPTDTLIAANGCDSIVTLNLTINSAATSTDVITSCTPITWIDGIVYSASTTTPTDTLIAVNGCDSVVTLNLTITNNVAFTQNPVLCQGDSVVVNGNVYTATGTFNDTIFGGAANGCDSMITTNLIVNSIATSTDIQTACNSLTWIDGNTYFTSTNTPTDTLIAANGCDSIVTLNLTINSTATFTQNPLICQGDTIVVNGSIYTTTGTFNDTIVGGSANGCDSIIITNLTVTPTQNTTQNFTECQGFSIAVGSNVYTTTGNFVDTLATSAGCDSIVNTNLTIAIPNTTSQNFVECQGFSVTVGTNTYTTTGTFIDVLNACDTIITNLTINPAPTLTLIKADDNCGENIGSVIALVQTTKPPIVYSWSTGSTDSIINNLPSGTYSLIINDANGCRDTAQTIVNETAIDCDFFVYLPNMFSPNGDGSNDVFFVRGKGIATLDLKIYNRWGNNVFETDDITQGWDGKYKDSEQNTAVFVFVVEGTFLNGKAFKESGDVSLIR